MNTHQFKTNIKCGGCVAAVTPYLDQEKDIEKWEVDLTHPDRILTINSEKLQPGELKKLIETAGYEAKLI